MWKLRGNLLETKLSILEEQGNSPFHVSGGGFTLFIRRLQRVWRSAA